MQKSSYEVLRTLRRCGHGHGERGPNLGLMWEGPRLALGGKVWGPAG